ncbi:T9SS type A sorting domain-containing protein [bacterium]|nr:T9SS type A sorting domain-containing protein [bacterium]
MVKSNFVAVAITAAIILLSFSHLHGWDGPCWYVDAINGDNTLGDGGPPDIPDHPFYDPEFPGHRPWKTITYALSQYDIGIVLSGDTIFISPGTYDHGTVMGIPHETFPLELRPGVSLIGSGFPDPTAGDDPEVIIDAEYSSRVVYGSSITNPTVLSGFTITRGGSGGGCIDNGGGIYLNLCSHHVLITNCVISYNKGGHWGGGICIMNGNPCIRNCAVIYNGIGCSDLHGGGIFIGNEGSDVSITNCVISYNEASYSQGGVSIENHATAYIDSCIISRNRAYYSGGGIGTGWESQLYMYNCIITENVVYGDEGADYGHAGGVLFANGSEMVNCLICNNIIETMPGIGGSGVTVWHGYNNKIINCTIAKNFSYNDQGGIILRSGDPGLPPTCLEIKNSIVSSNSSLYEMYIQTARIGYIEASHNIFYGGDTDTTVYNRGEVGDESTFVSWGWTECKVCNPVFEGSSCTPFKLSPTSPFVDNGLSHEADRDIPTFDIEGNPRPLGAGYSLGCYEVAATGIDEMLHNLPNSAVLALDVYPNPFNSVVHIQITAVGSSYKQSFQNKQIEIHDIKGRLIKDFDSPRSLSPASNPLLFSWEPSPNIPSGIYLVNAKCDNFSTSSKVLYLK